MKLLLSLVQTIEEVSPDQWDACAQGNPLVRHSFFKSLEASGSTGPLRGVVPQYVLLHHPDGKLLACAPAMLKKENKREFGPEIKWLRAGLRSGCFSWPKFQVDVPFCPWTTPKLLTHPDWPAKPLQQLLVNALHAIASKYGEMNAVNILHIPAEQAQALSQQGWLISHEVHSIWHNVHQSPSFDHYLADLPHRKRRMLNKDRRKVADMGFDLQLLQGDQITHDLMADFYAGWIQVCTRYKTKPWLPQELFHQLIRNQAESLLLFAAFDGGRYVAGALCMHSPDRLYVQTWSAKDQFPELFFELACYRPLMYALEHGIDCVDTGVFGLHKRHRGFLDEPSYNAHWFNNAELKELALTELSKNTPND